MIRKEFSVEKDGDWIVVNTGAVDRQRDRVLPGGAQLANYMANPVVLWGHNYVEPWAIIGRAAEITTDPDSIRIRVELREPANEQDPMHIIRLLWDAGLVRTASVGFNPLAWVDNAAGGRDYTSWEMLENSLVPVPANQEAMRLAVKALQDVPATPTLIVTAADLASAGPLWMENTSALDDTEHRKADRLTNEAAIVEALGMYVTALRAKLEV